MGINEKAAELAAVLAGTREFQELKQKTAAVRQNRQYWSMIEEYKRQEQQLMMQQLSEEAGRRKMDELQKAFAGMMKVPDIARLVEAEKAVAALLQQANVVVNRHLEEILKKA